ncbi:MAG: glycosyltransferase, partial [Acidimicrobiia bacterium]|nr:glycosyltransferase [Acidimicrobiia bacterium]
MVEPEFVFGYIGTHTPEKGIDLLLKAFAHGNIDARLRIWGAERAETKELIEIAAQFPIKAKNNIEWMGSYRNENIVEDVFNKVDAIVVPSIWGENSPLVIHEAQQVKVPVITSNYGGMAEYVNDGVNGLLFEHRNFMSLSAKMKLLAQDTVLYKGLAKKGYLYSDDGQIPAIELHLKEMERIYREVT